MSILFFLLTWPFYFPQPWRRNRKSQATFFAAPISSPACKLRLFPLKKKQGKKTFACQKKRSFFCRPLEEENNLPGSATFFSPVNVCSGAGFCFLGFGRGPTKKVFETALVKMGKGRVAGGLQWWGVGGQEEKKGNKCGISQKSWNCVCRSNANTLNVVKNVTKSWVS